LRIEPVAEELMVVDLAMEELTMDKLTAEEELAGVWGGAWGAHGRLKRCLGVGGGGAQRHPQKREREKRRKFTLIYIQHVTLLQNNL